MSPQSVALVLLGGLAQFAAVLLGVEDVRDRYRALTSFHVESRNRRASVSGVIRARTSATGRVTNLREPTIEERMKAVEERLERIPGEVDATIESAVALSRAHTAAAVGDLATNHDRELTIVKKLLVDALGGSHVRAYFAVSLALAGIAAQTLGSLL